MKDARKLDMRDVEYIKYCIKRYYNDSASDNDYKDKILLDSLNREYRKKDKPDDDKIPVFISNTIAQYKALKVSHKFFGYVYCSDYNDSDTYVCNVLYDDETYVQVDKDDISTLDELSGYTTDEIRNMFGQKFLDELKITMETYKYEFPLWRLRICEPFLFKDENSIPNEILDNKLFLTISNIEDGYVTFNRIDFSVASKEKAGVVVKYDDIIPLEELMDMNITKIMMTYPDKWRTVLDYIINPDVIEFTMSDNQCDYIIDHIKKSSDKMKEDIDNHIKSTTATYDTGAVSEPTITSGSSSTIDYNTGAITSTSAYINNMSYISDTMANKDPHSTKSYSWT